jgi:hypothetical protein
MRTTGLRHDVRHGACRISNDGCKHLRLRPEERRSAFKKSQLSIGDCKSTSGVPGTPLPPAD